MECVKGCNVCGSISLNTVDKGIGLCRCSSCGFVFYSPRPDAEEIARYYSGRKKYDAWIKDEKAREILWRRRIKKIKGYKKGGALLDVGAGTGQFLSLARDGFEVCGTEVSRSAAEIAKDRYGIDLKMGGIEDVDFGAKRFDVITLFHVLEHVHNPSAVLDKCRQLLRENGIIIIAVPNELNSFESFVKRPVKRFLSAISLPIGRRYGAYGLPKLTLDGSLDEIHLSFFTGSTLRRLMERHRFRVVDEALDPHYASTGMKKILDDLIYLKFLAMYKLLGVNIYPTIWIAAKADA